METTSVETKESNIAMALVNDALKGILTVVPANSKAVSTQYERFVIKATAAKARRIQSCVKANVRDAMLVAVLGKQPDEAYELAKLFADLDEGRR